MKYFESFPSLTYTFDKNTVNIQAVKNIFARNSFLREIKDNVNLSYEYSIKDSDTPEIIAFKEYGDAYRSWIILLFNNIINPHYDWPLKTDALDTYIKNKYNQTLEEALSTINHYEKIITKTQIYQGSILNRTVETTLAGEYDYNFTTNTLTPATLPGVADTSLIIGDETLQFDTYTLHILTEVKAVSNYQTEVDINESKRNIRILNTEYVQTVEKQFKELMSNG
jgi:hypothetical protein